MVLNDKLKELTMQAGFTTYDGDIDWTFNYDRQLQALYDIMVSDFIRIAEESCRRSSLTTHDAPIVGGVLREIMKMTAEEYGK